MALSFGSNGKGHLGFLDDLKINLQLAAHLRSFRKLNVIISFVILLISGQAELEFTITMAGGIKWVINIFILLRDLSMYQFGGPQYV